jgi:hypothetical protein
MGDCRMLGLFKSPHELLLLMSLYISHVCTFVLKSRESAVYFTTPANLLYTVNQRKHN